MKAKNLVVLVLGAGLVCETPSAISKDYSKLPELKYEESSRSIENFKRSFPKKYLPAHKYELEPIDASKQKKWCYFSYKSRENNIFHGFNYSERFGDGFNWKKSVEMVEPKDGTILYVEDSADEECYDIHVLVENGEFKIKEAENSRIEKIPKKEIILKIK